MYTYKISDLFGSKCCKCVFILDRMAYAFIQLRICKELIITVCSNMRDAWITLNSISICWANKGKHIITITECSLIFPFALKRVNSTKNKTRSSSRVQLSSAAVGPIGASYCNSTALPSTTLTRLEHSNPYATSQSKQRLLSSSERPLCRSGCLAVCLSVCLSVCLYVCLSVCMSVCLSAQNEATLTIGYIRENSYL